MSDGQEKSRLQYLQPCTRVKVGKTPSLLMGRRKVVSNIYSHALEFWWVRLPPANVQAKSRLQHLRSCTRVWVGKTPPGKWAGETSFAISRVMIRILCG